MVPGAEPALPCLGCFGWRRDERGSEALHWSLPYIFAAGQETPAGMSVISLRTAC